VLRIVRMSKPQSPKAAPRPSAARRAKCALVRGEPVVQRVLEATVEEVARVGCRALRVEDVAARAGVNKTTVYRRWPEKGALLREALSFMAHDVFVLPETGALRTDLLALGRSMVELSQSPRGQSIMRVLAAEGSDPEVADIKKSMRKTHESVPLAIISGAAARGELSPGFDHHLLFGTFMGAIHHKIFFMNEKVTGPYLERLVDMLVEGASPVSRVAAPASRARKAATRR
jgi:AcrR family transcriptional regulator